MNGKSSMREFNSHTAFFIQKQQAIIVIVLLF